MGKLQSVQDPCMSLHYSMAETDLAFLLFNLKFDN